ncbi:cytosolic Fe-S cluster assembly factor NUBP2 homolog [Daphnia carinata]|uniref:cytosolic Fe-S cluster assembly factor NUBP2 homolog n=1 Tax=Daphnia carinata TaxID=120202 RepID=UPI00257EF53D|nr:cytosolic Fe-S cluster assembly factor NUBP2 homolog [Daphnia carinata]
MASENAQILPNVKRIFLVLSGKGGVGKSTVSTQLALTLQNSGFKVGLLDIDLCGPSIPRMLGLENSSVHQCAQGWVPVYTTPDQTLGVMSVGFLLGNKDDPVIWRGPKKTAMIKQFLTDVYWQDLDYLIIDTPPGTSDEHISVMENLKSVRCDGAILVTTPQAVAVGDVRRELTFCKKTGLKVTGILENMCGYVCPHCSECTNIFSYGGGESLAEMGKVPFLGRIPIDPKLTKAMESGENFITSFNESVAAQTFISIVKNFIIPREETMDVSEHQ